MEAPLKTALGSTAISSSRLARAVTRTFPLTGEPPRISHEPFVERLKREWDTLQGVSTKQGNLLLLLERGWVDLTTKVFRTAIERK